MSEKKKEVEDAIRVRKYEDLFDDEQEFRLMLYELIKEFVKKNDAVLQIETRNGVIFYLHSKDKIEFDLKLSCVKIRSIVKRTQFESSSELCFEYTGGEKIQIIRLDDIISVTLDNELEEKGGDVDECGQINPWGLS